MNLRARGRCGLLAGSVLGLLWAGRTLGAASPAGAPADSAGHASHHLAAPAPDQRDRGGGSAGVGMSGAMDHMGPQGAFRPPFYPRLMMFDTLGPNERQSLLIEADDRMRAGALLIAEGQRLMTAPHDQDNAVTMRRAIDLVREGAGTVEEGFVVRHALRTSPGDVRQTATAWFRKRMNLRDGPIGTPIEVTLGNRSHLAFMGLLVVTVLGFALLYGFKMVRTLQMLAALARERPGDGTARPVPPDVPRSAPPPAGEEGRRA